MANTDQESPLLKALPPASDYYTYLTIIEYNLSRSTLPILQKVLQDPELTTNIGWDLVQLLAPYLPESEPCLSTIARLGNPREVILKVTEGLRVIEFEDDQDDQSDDEGETEAGAAEVIRAKAEVSTYPLKTAVVPPEGRGRATSQAVELPPPLPQAVSQFVYLLEMLATLHSRIKTKNPSRFLSTTLQAVLASFSNSSSHREEMIRAVVTFIKSIAGTKRPTLPNRQSSGMLTSKLLPKDSEAAAADPEAGPTTTELTPDEKAMQLRLLQSFLTHIVEEYMLNLPETKDDVPGLAWCTRVTERTHPERTMPYTKTLAHRFADEEHLHRRLDAIGQLANMANDLKLTDDELLFAALTPEKMPDPKNDSDAEDDPPDTAEDIPLSKLGSLFLYTAREVGSILYHNSSSMSSTSFSIFPDHNELTKNCLSAPNQGTGTLGSEPSALIDAVLVLGLLALEHNSIGEPTSDEEFTTYLQSIALLSSNCPSPNLRGHAHYLATTILRSHPDDEVRLAFIKDTLEHCPFENLKVSAVGWVKGETIEANPPHPLAGGHHNHEHEASATKSSSAHSGEAEEEKSIFAQPRALSTLSPYLFPSLTSILLTPPVQEAHIAFRTNVPFYVASLNFLYLLLSARHLHENLMIPELWKDGDIGGSFVQALREGVERLRAELEKGGRLDGLDGLDNDGEVVAEMNVVEDAVGRVEGVVKYLNE